MAEIAKERATFAQGLRNHIARAAPIVGTPSSCICSMKAGMSSSRILARASVCSSMRRETAEELTAHGRAAFTDPEDSLEQFGHGGVMRRLFGRLSAGGDRDNLI